MSRIAKKLVNRAIFLDRDGTVIRHVELLRDIRGLRLLPRAAEALRTLRRFGYLLILVTNQPVIARGLATEEAISKIHKVMQKRLERQGARLDAIYTCPHHPNANVKRYRMKCDCRKPEIGSIIKAAREFTIDLRKSFMVGDSTRDTLAGNRANLTTILVKTGYGGRDPWQFSGKPDVTVKNLREAVRYIRTHGERD